MKVEDPHVEALLEAAVGRPGASRAQTLDVRLGPFWVVVQTTAGTGMASTLARETNPHAGFPVPDAGHLHERAPLELAELLRSSSTVEAAVGLAAVNALVGEPGGTLTDVNAEAVIRDRGSGCSVAVIGHFPFVDRLRPLCRELWVFERPRNRQPGDHGPEDMAELLPKAEVVAMTATTLINHTLHEILELVSPAAFLLMVGPSTPLCGTMFDCGFELLCGSLVVDSEAVIRQASQGAVTRQIQGVRRVAMARGDDVRP
jgi:uncharacterized protein (DUF4213/DUF364 family)